MWEWQLKNWETLSVYIPSREHHLTWLCVKERVGANGWVMSLVLRERVSETASFVTFFPCPVLGHITAFSKAVVGCVPVGISVRVLSPCSGTENAFWASPQSFLRRWEHTTGSVAFFLWVVPARRYRQEVNIQADLLQSSCKWPVQISPFS